MIGSKPIALPFGDSPIIIKLKLNNVKIMLNCLKLIDIPSIYMYYNYERIPVRSWYNNSIKQYFLGKVELVFPAL